MPRYSNEVTERRRATSFYIHPWKQGSRSATALAQALGGRVLRVEGSKFRPGLGRKVINWGSSTCPWDSLNLSKVVTRFGNKLSAFLAWKQDDNGPRVPDFTTEPQEAQDWLKKKDRVVCRGTLIGHSGAGITILDEDYKGDLPKAPLYVKYIPKDEEYRCHVFKAKEGFEVIDVQRKIRDPDREPSDWRVRSHQNGFIYARTGPNGVYKDTCPKDVLDQGVKALASSGLSFGAVDLVWNKKAKKAYCLEVNCAPGLDGSTPEIYAAAIKRFYDAA